MGPGGSCSSPGGEKSAFEKQTSEQVSLLWTFLPLGAGSKVETREGLLASQRVPAVAERGGPGDFHRPVLFGSGRGLHPGSPAEGLRFLPRAGSPCGHTVSDRHVDPGIVPIS